MPPTLLHSRMGQRAWRPARQEQSDSESVAHTGPPPPARCSQPCEAAAFVGSDCQLIGGNTQGRAVTAS